MKIAPLLALAAVALTTQSLTAQAAPTPVSLIMSDDGYDLVLVQTSGSTATGSNVVEESSDNVFGFNGFGGLTLGGVNIPTTLTESATLADTGNSTFSISNGTFTRSLNLSEGAGTYSGTFSGTGSLYTQSGVVNAKFKADVIITGGTGVFAGLSGDGTIEGHTLLGLAPSISDYIPVWETFTDQGTISAVPLPASLPMFSAALLGLLGIGVKARRNIAA